jgi:subtilisin family serine protease
MKLVFKLTLALCLFTTATGQAAELTAKQESSIAPELTARIESASGAAEYHVIVRFASPDATPDYLGEMAASAPTLKQRYEKIGNRLRSSAAPLNLALRGRSSVVRRFWIANIAEMRVDREALLDLAGRDDVVMIAPNASIELLDPVSITDAVSAAAGAGPNLQAIGARALWVRGLTGKGRLVASLDTGVEGVHPALANSWRGKHGDTSASWFDPLNGSVPTDASGHGTHVMGIMVGRDGADTIGLAPDAEWICAAVVDRGRSLATTFTDILAALQWIVDPDGNPATMSDVPDVVCNSWGVSQEIISPCDQFFFEAIDNVEAMGIVCVFAAGNEGPYTMSIRNPADRATSPTASFSVGAADANVSGFPVPAFSSRGPSACDGSAKKPEIAAPGVAIRSAFKGQTYKLINGTSMAAPHVAAAVALLRQYNPELTPEQIKTALLTTARDIDAPGEDNASGRGLIDLEAAVASLPSPNYPVVSTGQVTLDPDGDGVPALGEDVELVVPVFGDVVDAENVSLQLSMITMGATITSGSSYLGTIPAGGSVSNASAPFVVHISENATAGDSVRFELSMTGDPLLNWWRDTVSIMVGVPEGAALATAADGAAQLTLSNFGQLGLADGSSFDAGGSGWRTSFVDANILYEGALLVSSANGGWSDASRRESGAQQFDFLPQPAAAPGVQCFDDSRSLSPIGVTIDQHVYPVYRSSSYEITSVAWVVRNSSGLRIDDLRLGWLVDIDLPGTGASDENIEIDPLSGGYLHTTDFGGGVAGLTPLSGSFGALNFFEHLGPKQELSTANKKAAMSGHSSLPGTTGDYFAICATNPVDLGAGDSIVIAVAFIAANSTSSFSAAGTDARNRWLAIADIGDDEGGGVVPYEYALDQNYPNPFNAGTTIPVSIAGDGSRLVRLDVIDVLGRRVRTLHNGVSEPGSHTIFWDGRDDSGNPVASGVYFARLLIGGETQQVRSMVLIK